VRCDAASVRWLVPAVSTVVSRSSLRRNNPGGHSVHPGRLWRSLPSKPQISYLQKINTFRLLPVAARSKAWICGGALPGIVGSNPSASMNVCLVQCLSRKGLCDGPIHRPEEPYQLWCVSGWDQVKSQKPSTPAVNQYVQNGRTTKQNETRSPLRQITRRVFTSTVLPFFPL
jgi:hypothetical protein